MRDRMERLVLLPFSLGCVSESSVAIGVHNTNKRTKPAPDVANSSSSIRTKEEDEESLSSTESMKSSLKFLALSKPSISTRYFHRIIKGFKNFSQLLVFKDGMEALEMEMDIGLPTDVKHVTHIGWDGSAAGSATTSPIMGWDNLIPPHGSSLPPLQPSAALMQLHDQLPLAAQVVDAPASSS